MINLNINAFAELAMPIVFMMLAILMIAFAIIIAIREKKSTITNEREKDVIDKFVETKKQQLAAIPGAISFKIYAAILFIAPILFGVGVYIVSQSFVFAIIGAVAGVLLPELVIKLQKGKSDADFDEKYGRALKQMSSTLRAGMTIQQAVDDVCTNPFLDDQIRDMFTQISSDIKVGIPMGQAFKKAAEIRNTKDTRDVAAAVAMQTEVGGSEAEVIEKVSNNINDRIMTRKEIRTLFTTTKITVYAMDIAPPFVLIFLIFNSGDLGAYYFNDFTGMLVLIGFFVLLFIGSIISHKMMNSANIGSD